MWLVSACISNRPSIHSGKTSLMIYDRPKKCWECRRSSERLAAAWIGPRGRRSLCAVRCRDAAIYRRLESVPVDEVGVVVVVGVLIQQLTSPQKKHTPDPTAHKRLKETHDPCASLVPAGNTNRD